MRPSQAAAPRELWILYVLKLLESFAYFSLSYVLVLYLSEEFGYSDQGAGWLYGFFGMLISLYGVFVGFIIDQLGVKRSLARAASSSHCVARQSRARTRLRVRRRSPAQCCCSSRALSSHGPTRTQCSS